MYILITRILNALYGYEAINLLLRVAPSRIIIRILRYYGATIGDGVRISSPFTIHNADQSKILFANLTIGDDCYIGRDCIIDLIGIIQAHHHIHVLEQEVIYIFYILIRIFIILYVF